MRIISFTVILLSCFGLVAQPNSFLLECENQAANLFTQNPEEPENGCPCYEGTIDNSPYTIYFEQGIDSYVWVLADGFCGNHVESGEELFDISILNCNILQANPLSDCQILSTGDPVPPPAILLECENETPVTFIQNSQDIENGCPCYEGTIENTPHVIYLEQGIDSYVWVLADGFCGNHGESGEELFDTAILNCNILQALPLTDCQVTPLDAPAIPTLSQWGLIILGISLVILVTVSARQRGISIKSMFKFS